MASEVKLIGYSNANTGNLDTPSYSKSIYFVEPLGGQPVDNKELMIYVDLTASRKVRSVLQLTDQGSKIKNTKTSNSEINLIGYREGIDGNLTTRFMTTDWSNKPNLSKNTIPGTTTDLSPGARSNVFEGFGVESMTINITAMNPPVVNIKFIDTRGGGLFDQETFNDSVEQINAFQNSSSPYSIFFEMPPPLFYLTIKGFYGNPVRLCLYMTKWDGTFNAETGNFEMNANFLGYTFAFLQDIKVGHLIGAGNTDAGRRKLVEVSSQPTTEKYTFQPLTLDDLLVRFQRITIKREEEQKNSEEFQKLKVINEQINFIKQFKVFLGNPTLPNITSKIDGPNMDIRYFKPNTEQLFFRDVGVLVSKKTDDDSSKIESSYKELYKLIDTNLTKLEDLKKGFEKDFYEQGNVTKGDLGLEESLNNLPWFSNLDDTLTELNKEIADNEPDVTIPTITKIDFTGRTQGKVALDSGFYIINLKGARQNLDKKLKNLNEYKKRQEEVIQNKFNKEVTDILGFEPNIRNIMGILCNNIEMFLELLYDVGKNAEKLNGDLSDPNNNQRYRQLGGVEFDSSEKDTKVYPFPKVLDKDSKEVFIGTLDTVTNEVFPELKFVQDLSTGIVYSIKQISEFNQALKNLETISKLESFPINVRDVGISPYTTLDYLPPMQDSESNLNLEIVRTIIQRAFASYVVSKYKDANFNKIGELEGINLYESLVSDDFKKVISQINGTNLLTIATEYNVINNLGGSYSLNGSIYTDCYEIDSNGSTNSGNRLWSRILNLKESISKSLKITNNDDSEINKFTSPKQTDDYVYRFFDKTNVFLNKSYFSIKTFKDNNIKTIIKGGRDLKNANLVENFTIDKLIPDYFNCNPTNSNPNYLPFTKSSLYVNSSNNDYATAYLLLSSIKFDGDKILDEEIGDDFTKIIRLPYYYLLWLGANAYRSSQSADILNFNSEYPAVPINQYYYIKDQTTDVIYNPFLINLFKSLFVNWVSGTEFLDLKSYFEEYLNTDNLGDNKKKRIITNISALIFPEHDLHIYDSTCVRLGLSSVDQTMPSDKLLSYLNDFMAAYKVSYNNGPKGDNGAPKKENTDTTSKVVKDPDFSFAFYMDLKQIYDNWIAGNPTSSTYGCCNTAGMNVKTNTKQKLFDMFKFVDKFRNSVAGDAIININSFSNLLGAKDNGLYSFISKVLTDSYFMHFNLPFYIEFNNINEVRNIFDPQTTLEETKGSPNFLCVYNGPPSTSLKSTSYYGDDSFSFFNGKTTVVNGKTVPLGAPKAVFDKKENEVNPYLVAFNLNYGAQTQSIFKTISVGTQESKVTGEYITSLSNYVLGTGESKPLLKDNSIYPLMRNRSYTSTVEMMGNMMIQPQMYFQLNNIPFFSGSYMIMNVSHQVTPNNIKTTFKGVRQNRSPVSIITKATTYLNFQYDQGVYTSTTVVDKTTPVEGTSTSTGANTVVTPTDLKNYKPSVGNNILRYYDENIEFHLGIDIEVESPTTSILGVPKKGTVLYNEPGTITSSGLLIIKHDPEADGYTYFTGYFKLVDNFFSDGQNISGNRVIGRPSSFNGYTEPTKVVTPSQPNSTTGNVGGTVEDVPKTPFTKYYYHFEVKRTTSDRPVNTFDDYLQIAQPLNPEQFMGDIKREINPSSVHGKIY